MGPLAAIQWLQAITAATTRVVVMGGCALLANVPRLAGVRAVLKTVLKLLVRSPRRQPQELTS